MIGDLIDMINDLIDEGVINRGNGNALIQDLQHALRELGRGNTARALKFMEDYMKRVEKWSGQQIPAEEANILLAYGQAIIDTIASP
jgi:hypothetical protein